MDLKQLRAELARTPSVTSAGRVRAVTGLAVRATLPGARIGEVVRIRRRGEPLDAEIVGFSSGEIVALALGDVVGVGPDELQAAFGKIDLANVAELLLGMLAGLAGAFSNMVLLLVVAAFMTLDAVEFSSRLPRVRRERPEVIGALDGFVHGTRSYLLVATVFGLIVAVVDTGFLWLVGVPLPLLWGLLAFITNYIPNIGFVIGLVPPAMLALLEGGPQLMLVVVVAYSVINFVIQSIIQPKYVADAADLSLTLTFLSLIFWAFVIGPLGAVLAVPLTLLAKAMLLDMDPNTRWMSSLIAGGSARSADTDATRVTPHPEPEIAPADPG